MALKLIWNDILTEKTDAFVTPASRNPRVGIGLDKVVHAVAGPKLLEARQSLGPIGPGRVGVSPSFGLKKPTGAKFVIHALGPVWSKNCGRKDELILDGCYLRILCKAKELGCKTVSMPVLSSGKFGMPMHRAVAIAVKAIEDFLAAFPQMTVKLVGIDSEFYECAKKLRPELVQAKYDEKREQAYRCKTGSQRQDDPNSHDDGFTFGETDDYFHEATFRRDTEGKDFKQLFGYLWRVVSDHERKARDEAPKAKARPRAYLITRADLSRATGISERTIKNFCSLDKTSSHTSKDKIVALSVAFRLPADYTVAFLATCGHALGTTGRDGVIRDFIEKQQGDVFDLNLLLEKRGMPVLATASD